MSNTFEPTNAQRAAWATWVQERPECIRVVAERFQPWKLYRMKSTGHRVVVLSFAEPSDSAGVTLRVAVSGEYNLVAFERQVFGIDPDDLEECDLPGPGDVIGSAGMSIEEARGLHETIRKDVN